MFGLPETFVPGLVSTVVFAVLGVLALVGGFRLFDQLLGKVDFQLDVMKASPVAGAVVIAAFLLGLSHIIASVVH